MLYIGRGAIAGGTAASIAAMDGVDNLREVQYPTVAVIARGITLLISGALSPNMPPIPRIQYAKVPPGAKGPLGAFILSPSNDVCTRTEQF